MRTMLIVGLLVSAGCGGEDLTIGSTTSAVNHSLFKLPTMSVQDRTAIIRSYDAVDPGGLVPRGLLEDALLYFETNAAYIPQKAYFVVVDLSLFSGQDRFWLVNLSTGAVEAHKVAHGSGSDPDHDGYATIFSNTSGSHQSSLGFSLTAEIYDGKYPHSMRLDGLSPDGSPNGMANTKMRSRLIVVHEASYVKDSNTSKQGRSWGCFALDNAIEADVVNRIHGGTLFYTATSALNPPVGRASCGDSVCEGIETASSCPIDCQAGGTNPGGTDPGGTDPGGTNPGGTDPGGTNPGGTDPGGTNPGGTNPNPGGTNPNPDGTYPDGTYPDGTYPEGTYPEGTYPGAAVPGNPDPSTSGGRLGPQGYDGRPATTESVIGGCAVGGGEGSGGAALIVLGMLWLTRRQRRTG